MKKYRHHFVFKTDVTGDTTYCDSFDSNDLIPSQIDLMLEVSAICTKNKIVDLAIVKIAIMNISTTQM